MTGWRVWLGAVCLVLGLFFPMTDFASAGDQDANQAYRQRIGFWGGQAEAFHGDFKYRFVSFNPYWGIFLTRPGPGYTGAWELAVEGFYHNYIDDFADGREIGFAPTIRWHYGFEEFISPYAEFGLGILHTDLNIPDTGTEINFHIHLGVGVNFRLNEHIYLSTGYRLRHLSNANMSVRNSGIDYHQGILGLSYYY